MIVHTNAGAKHKVWSTRGYWGRRDGDVMLAWAKSLLTETQWCTISSVCVPWSNWACGLDKFPWRNSERSFRSWFSWLIFNLWFCMILTSVIVFYLHCNLIFLNCNKINIFSLVQLLPLKHRNFDHKESLVVYYKLGYRGWNQNKTSAFFYKDAFPTSIEHSWSLFPKQFMNFPN
jgi:hypothetical protein